jgi:hypothetical protein
MSDKNKSLDWAKKCADSKGSQVMLPEGMIEKAKEMFKLIDEINTAAAKVNKDNIKLNNVSNNLWFAAREALEEACGDKVYKMDMNFDEEAKKDGYYVINFSMPRPKTPGMNM